MASKRYAVVGLVSGDWTVDRLDGPQKAGSVRVWSGTQLAPGDVARYATRDEAVAAGDSSSVCCR